MSLKMTKVKILFLGGLSVLFVHLLRGSKEYPTSQGQPKTRSTKAMLQCDACAGKNQEKLRQARCTADAVQDWCAAMALEK